MGAHPKVSPSVPAGWTEMQTLIVLAQVSSDDEVQLVLSDR